LSWASGRCRHLAALGEAHRDGARQRGHVREGDDIDDAGAAAGRREVDGADARVRVRAPHERHVQGERAPDVGDVGAPALQEALVLAPLEASADVVHARDNRARRTRSQPSSHAVLPVSDEERAPATIVSSAPSPVTATSAKATRLRARGQRLAIAPRRPATV
jgi:hypothetical protein